jgi:hypothetical protein
MRLRKIQNPSLICSDWASFISIIDPDFKGKHLTRGEVDQWRAGLAKLDSDLSGETAL